MRTPTTTSLKRTPLSRLKTAEDGESGDGRTMGDAFPFVRGGQACPANLKWLGVGRQGEHSAFLRYGGLAESGPALNLEPAATRKNLATSSPSHGFFFQRCHRPQITRTQEMTNAARFEAFMRSYQDMVYSTAYRLLANHAEAEDISQEVFLKAYDHFDSIGDSPTAGGWLKTVTTNRCLNHLSRYRKRWRFFSDLRREDDDAADFESTVPDELPDLAPGESADRKELLEQALAGLPRDQRVAVVLYHLDGMAYQDIADRLNISLSKVKTDIMRGRQALLARLRPRQEELGFSS